MRHVSTGSALFAAALLAAGSVGIVHFTSRLSAQGTTPVVGDALWHYRNLGKAFYENQPPSSRRWTSSGKRLNCRRIPRGSAPTTASRC